MDTGLVQIAEASRRYGADPLYVFGGGGNTSFKTNDTLYMKPSGVELATIQADDFVPMDRASVRDMLKASLPADAQAREAAVKDLMMAAVRPGGKGRPSVETPMHELFPQPFVVHTHHTWMNGLACAMQAEERARELFPDAMWVPYVDPGYTLSKEMERRIDAYTTANRRPPAVAIMQNHGLVVAGDSIEEIDRLHEGIMAKLKAAYEAAGVSLELAVKAMDDEEIGRVAPQLRTLLGTADTRAVVNASGWFLPAQGPFTPDHIVYAKSFHFEGEPTVDSLDRFHQSHGYAPVIVEIAQRAVFASATSLKSTRLAMEAARNASLVQQLSDAFGGPHYLSEREYRFIEQWEVESYRKKVSLGSGPAGRLEGRIALVTGGAQGFGFGIAEGLLAEGATVIVADINADGAAAAAAAFQRQFGSGRAWHVAVNIGEEASVEAMAREIVAECGGLDLLIANAGVLRADSVKTFAKKDWDFVTNINYTGYFLCVKHLAPLMARQVVEGRGAWTDIVQINSKSGLQGSNRNAAYAGSKFGTIGLTQSFAMELVEDRIKVNSICPGNFFDGPLWSDPERGLFVQYLRTGKVPGAQTIDDVRAAYEAKVPMGRGCRPADVVKAILYCVEQEYETGQAIPVTGGQVMLN